MSHDNNETPLAILQRWEDCGGTWRIVRMDDIGVHLDHSPAPVMRS